MVCFRHISVNTLHKEEEEDYAGCGGGGGDDDDDTWIITYETESITV
jgi:hypothetical protein